MKNFWKRILALSLAGILTAGAMLPASAAAIPPAVDETYYATLDYYGGVREASVVKSYRLNGADAVTDYGVYDEVVNLTDGTPVTLKEGSADFHFDQSPSHFYFEGKTKQPFQNLPWTVTLRYTLNGVPVRAEELALEPGYRDGFDVATSRAVAAFPLLCELCLPFVKVGGVFLAMKSVDSAAETAAGERAVKRLGGKHLEDVDYPIPGTDTLHRLVRVEKTAPTPKGLPRSWGKIKKAPL